MRFKKYLLMLVTTLLLALSLIFIPSTSANRARSKPNAKANNKISQPSGKTSSALLPARVPLPNHLAAQEQQLVPYSAQAADFAVSPPLSEMGIDTKEVESMRRFKDPLTESPEKNTSPPLSGVTDTPAELAASVQSSTPTLNIPAPASAPIEGLSNQDNANHPAVGIRVLPPDTVGDVGPNHYVQATNLLFRIFDKSGAPLTPPQPISVLFAALGPPCSNTDDGDPIVLYDSFADRWVITQFMVSGAAPLSQCFAVSQTGDPTGAYFTYRFVMPNIKFNDYPKFGVWPDGYYLSNNQFNLAGTAFLGVGVFALNRAKLLAGDPTANFIYFDLETAVPNARSMLPSDADGLNPPPPGAPNVFSYFNANEFVGETDSLRLYEFHADFANPANSTFTQRAESPVAVAAFDPRNPAGLDDIEQPPPAGATAALDSISDRLMNRLQYRNFGTHESLIVNHTVNVGTGTTLATHQAGVRYYELRRAPAGNWTVNEQATFAPDTDNRWMGSAAMDNRGNLAVGYSVSSLTVFPSIRYAGRLATDPPNGLFQGENTIQAGGFSQVSTGSRWGDYSSLNVDPTDDCTFWYTQMYYGADNPATTIEWLTKIGSFKFAECAAPAQGTLQVNVTNCETGLPLTGASVTINGNLYGATEAGGTFSTQLPPGNFNVSAAATNFTSASTTTTITNGNTTVVNLCITPTPTIVTDGSALVAESCPPETDAIDPGETVTVDFTLKNIGAANTTNLVATLQPTGGVTSPSAPQNYGVLAVGGPSVTRSFTFTADSLHSCGDDIIATLQLQDGANNLGTVTFTLTTGALSAPFGGSSGNVAVTIPDLTTVEVPIEVNVNGVVNNPSVNVRINHTFDGDLEIRLVHPDGTTVLLSDNRGSSGVNFGTGANDCSGTHTVFNDAAATAISAGTAPFAGSFRPEQPLAALNGKPTAGTWKLRVTDTANLDTGTIGCVQLELRARERLCCPFTGGEPAVAAAPPATVETESCSLPNGAPDPDETVTVQFPLQNIGTGLTNNLVATLLPGGGVLAPSGPQSYGVLSPVGPPVSRPFTFAVAGSCGSTITATLQLQDGATNLGTVSFNITIGSTATTQTSVSNPGSIIINDTPRVGGIALATPYPSTINVSGVTGTVTKVTLLLDNFSHTFPGDVDIVLVGPGGQRVLLMSDVGGGTDAVNADLTFDDAGPAIGAAVITGTFRPTNSLTGDIFPAPGPVAPFDSLLAVFNGVNPNGTWSLFVVDDAGTDAGSISGGWRLNITTEEPVCCDSPCTLTCPADIIVSNDPGECGANVSFSANVAGSCGVVTYSHQPGSFFPVGTTAVTATATRQDGSTQSCTFNVTVNDTEGPAVGPVSASPNSLWPPNHKMKDVTLTYNVGVDNCPGAVTCVVSSITSNEPVNGNGDGNTSPDWEIVSPTLVRLRAERSGGGTGRVYTITVRCTDARGNHTFRTTTVTVPHNQ